MKISKKLEQLYHDMNEAYEAAVLNPPYCGNFDTVKKVLIYFKNTVGKKHGWRVCNKDATDFYIDDIKEMYSYLHFEEYKNRTHVSYYLLSTLELAMRVMQRKGKANFGFVHI